MYRRGPLILRRQAPAAFADPDRSGTAPRTIRGWTRPPPSSRRICAPRSGGNTQAAANHDRKQVAGGCSARRRAPATRSRHTHEPHNDTSREKTADTSLKPSDVFGNGTYERERTGGPRCCCGEWKRTGHGASVACQLAARLGSETLTTRGVRSTPAFGDAGIRAVPGKKGHREDCSAGPAPWLAPPIIEPICEQ